MNSRKRRALVFQGFMITGGTFGYLGAGVSGLNTMDLGINLRGIDSYSGVFPFSNLMYSAGQWQQTVGTGAFTQNQGEIAATVGTDQFRLYLSDVGSGMVPGTYTVYNPSGANVGIGGFGDQGLAAYTTATSFTFTYTSGGLFLHCKGSLTRASGNLAIIIPGHTASWLSGDPFNSAFISFHQAMGAKVLRFMDWQTASVTFETEWADRTNPAGITFYSKYALAPVAPYELICSLSNRLGAHPWVCVPPRATVNYTEQMAALFAAQLSSPLKIHLELGNELWNYANPWIESTSWIEYLDHTRKVATANFGANTYTLAAHGFTSGDLVLCYRSRENYALGLAPHFATSRGFQCGVEVIDANTFKLHESTLAGAVSPVVAGQVNVLFVVKNEAGKVSTLNTHYAEVSLRNWDIFDAAMGVGRIEHIIAGQAVNSGIAAQRLTPDVLARVDAISPAPYFDHFWFGGAVDISTGQLLPKFWANSACTVHVGVYAAGATPSIAEVLAGTGALSKQSFAHAYTASTFVSGTAFTGLTNGTPYSIHYVAVDANGYEWTLSGSVVASATPSTANILDTYTALAKRGRRAAAVSASYVKNHMTAAPNVKIYCYEGGSHDNQLAPAAIQAWFNAYFESVEFTDVMLNYLRAMAAVGTKLHCYFSDSGTANGPFMISNGYSDITDRRYVAFSGLGGKIQGDTFAALDVAASNILTAPASLPYVVHTFPDSSLTYIIANGDNNGNYAIVGNELRLVNAAGINWGLPTNSSLLIEATKGALSKYLTVSFSTGDAWYQGDSKFAWSAVTDADTTTLDPATGSSLPLLNGTAATNSGGLLTFDATKRYGSATALSGSLDHTKPFLIAVVLDKNANNTDTRNHVYTGGSLYVTLQNGNSTNNTRIRFEGWLGTAGAFVGGYTTPAATPAGKQVHWMYYDGAGSIKVGLNQTENSASAISGSFSGPVTQNLFIGGSSGGASSLAKIGAVQHVSRAGMTLSDAKAIVQKMQILHGI